MVVQASLVAYQPILREEQPNLQEMPLGKQKESN